MIPRAAMYPGLSDTSASFTPAPRATGAAARTPSWRGAAMNGSCGAIGVTIRKNGVSSGVLRMKEVAFLRIRSVEYSDGAVP